LSKPAFSGNDWEVTKLPTSLFGQPESSRRIGWLIVGALVLPFLVWSLSSYVEQKVFGFQPLAMNATRELGFWEVWGYYCFGFLNSALVYFFVARWFIRLLAIKKPWAPQLVFSIYLFLYCFAFYFSAGKAIYFPAEGTF
jgi:hypothetical protein